jgi:hypothetical protein
VSTLVIVPSTVTFIPAFRLNPASVFGQSISGVTGAAEGVFPGGTTFNGVPVTGLQFSMGVFIPGDTTASGQFEATLLGAGVGGLANIEIGGDAANGAINSHGSRTFSGTATVDMGDGSPPQAGVPFTIIASPNTLLLTTGVTSLPMVWFTAGDYAID